MEKERKTFYIGFDFSINKPACTILHDDKFDFFIWPLFMEEKVEKLYTFSKCVHVHNRNMERIHVKTMTTSETALEHTKRSVALADMIIEDIMNFIHSIEEDPILYISSEGLSFNSRGDATLNLATYKGVLYGKIYEKLHPVGLYTYAPVSIKSVAKAAKKKDYDEGYKVAVIHAFMNQENLKNNKFAEYLKDGLYTRKKNYMECVDDIADSYWALITMLAKENLLKE